MTGQAGFRIPPGSTWPAQAQGLISVLGQNAALRRLHRRHGDVFSLRLPGLGVVVVVADPALVRQVFTADPAVLHAGSGSPLGAVLGPHSLLAIDERRHLAQRRLLLPPFHGERLRAYRTVIREEARREIATWPEGRGFPTLRPMMRITLNAVLRLVFGARGGELRALQRLVPRLVTLGASMALLPALRRDLGPASPWGRFVRLRARFDAHVDELIAAVRRDPALEARDDVLALLLRTRHEDGTPMTRDAIADQLLTLLAAGHETTASSLAWAVERLRRHPAVLARLAEEAAAGGGALREAAIREVQRVRPAIATPGRFVRAPFALGEWLLPPGTTVVCSALLIHEDERWYPHAHRFDPDRFLGGRPDTYAWISFGGGIRRCLGAAFAEMEMDEVLRTLLTEVELLPTDAADERWRFRGVAFAPARGGRAAIRRPPAPSAPPADLPARVVAA